jgi:hypothetical protein
MKDAGGRITLIDFGFSGPLGSAVPSFIPSWVYDDGIFSIGIDLKAFDERIGST